MTPGAAVPAARTASESFREGTLRVVSPESTWVRIREVLPAAGITRVADVTRLDVLGIPTFQAIRPGSANLSVSQGKGATAMAARVSAAMESLEMWHAEDLSGLPTVTLSAPEMAWDNPLRTNDLRWRVPPDRWGFRPLEWVRGASLRDGGRVWLPRAMLELRFLFDGELRPRPFLITSSGLASGNCDEEALLHALCELIERDAVAAAQRGEILPIPLSVGSDAPDWLRRIQAALERAAARVALADATSRFGVPVVVADLLLDDIPFVFRGSGCHPDPAIACSRALTEAAQSRLTWISGARDDLPSGSARGRELSSDAFTVPRPVRRLDEMPSRTTGSVADDLAAVVARLVAEGREPFAVPLRRPAAGLPVWFCFVPGLREPRHG